MAAFFKNLSRFLSAGKSAPEVYLAAFGKHPGWNDHIDDLGLDTDALVTAKRLLYIQGISQNIDSGAWEALEPPALGNSIVGGVTRLEHFRHDFLWHVTAPEQAVLAGRLWSSQDGKGRDKYPMALCAELIGLPDQFAAQVALPFLARVHERCAAATKEEEVRSILDDQRNQFRARVKSSPPTDDSAALSPHQLAGIARHPDMLRGSEGFHRIVYQFVRVMAPFHLGAHKNSSPRRTEQIRVPICGLTPPEALLFWLRFSLTLLDPETPLLLFAPDQGAGAPWVDLIVGDPAPANLFCIKAGTKSLPFTSDIPYTLERSFTAAVDEYVATCASAPEGSPLPPWPAM